MCARLKGWQWKPARQAFPPGCGRKCCGLPSSAAPPMSAARGRDVSLNLDMRAAIASRRAVAPLDAVFIHALTSKAWHFVASQRSVGRR